MGILGMSSLGMCCPTIILCVFSPEDKALHWSNDVENLALIT